MGFYLLAQWSSPCPGNWAVAHPLTFSEVGELSASRYRPPRAQRGTAEPRLAEGATPARISSFLIRTWNNRWGRIQDQGLLCISFHFCALIELMLFYVRDERANQNPFLFLVNSLSLFQLFIFILYCSNRWHIKNEFTFWELYAVQLILTI